MAWLHAVPKNETKGALAKTIEAVSRLQTFRKDGRVIPLPENPAPYLTDWLFEIGPVIQMGEGAKRIEWPDIAAWAGVMGVAPLPWEARLLRRLSGEYAVQWVASAKPDCPAPWISEVIENRNVVANKVATIFGGRARKV